MHWWSTDDDSPAIEDEETDARSCLLTVKGSKRALFHTRYGFVSNLKDSRVILVD